VWSSETGPGTWTSGDVGVLGILSLIVNKTVFKGRWRIIVRPAPDSRSSVPTSGSLWHRDVKKRQLDQAMDDLARRIESGAFVPETAAEDVV
jgi:hypothetical protein